MTPAPIPGYLTKKEVEERYGRSHRSLTRDFSAAVRTQDQKVLPHLKLQTEDGTVRQGSEVTLDEIQKLSNQGLSPTWYVAGEWAAERYGARSAPAPERATPKTSDTPPASRPVGDNGDLVRRLEGQIQELQQDKEKLYNELGIKNEQIQQANERTRESNVLMKELQTLLGNVQARALLPLPVEPNRKAQDAVLEGEEAVVVTTPMKSKARAEKGSARSKSKPAPAPAKAEPAVKAAAKPEWYEMPTLGRLVSRRKS